MKNDTVVNNEGEWNAYITRLNSENKDSSIHHVGNPDKYPSRISTTIVDGVLINGSVLYIHCCSDIKFKKNNRKLLNLNRETESWEKDIHEKDYYHLSFGDNDPDEEFLSLKIGKNNMVYKYRTKFKSFVLNTADLDMEDTNALSQQIQAEYEYPQKAINELYERTTRES